VRGRRRARRGLCRGSRRRSSSCSAIPRGESSRASSPTGRRSSRASRNCPPDWRSDGANGSRDGVTVHRLWAHDDWPDRRLPYLGSAAPLKSRPSAEESAEALRNSSPHCSTGELRVSLIKFAPSDEGRFYGLHWHDTLDVQWLFAGSLAIGLDDGSEVWLEPGDVVVQHATNHSWRIGPEGAVLGLAMQGIERIGSPPPAADHRDSRAGAPAA
jgi:hypothetical protein